MKNNIESESGVTMKGWRKALRSVSNWLAHKDKDEWLKDMRGILSLVAALIASLTFQSAINPPGGVVPAKESGEVQCRNSSCSGQAVLALVYPNGYTSFLYCNTVCFVSSLAVCLLLVSGLSLNNRFFTWLLSIGMCISLSSLTLTYLFGAQMVVPDLVWGPTTTMFGRVIIVWMILLGLIAFFLSLRLLVWILTKCICRHSEVRVNPTI